ncbi:hypothetical protein ASD22_03425 [Rhodanobacter sp. Root480]|jgi:hypothetical protein|uniref:rolling circle replication-associated protein n=1 Tax=Rhodanobacter sp. Root480 TaxID=1736542 RepID=UPI0006F44721|nr:hypothetical protein [Rhodanobacter sp. Root480]KQX99327.1 hypothetical protein ASD22_03425 [Rhodanobacter sp. Root480]
MQADVVVIDPRKARCQRLRRTITEAAKLHEREARWASDRLGRSAYRKTFITLTYRPGETWEPRHVSRFVRLMRQWFQRRGHACRFAWVGELQKRGALHYHVLVWVPRRLRLPRPDQCGWWPYGMSNIETARNPVGYMVKYATKTRPEDVKRLPKGVRLHGNGGHDPARRVELRERLWPMWVAKAWDQRRGEACFADLEAQEAWNARRIEVRTPQPDGSVWLRYVDPVRPPEGSAAWWDLRVAEEERRIAEEEQWCMYARRYERRGFPKLQRVAGGFVDLVTGELIPTPWCVDVSRGVVRAYLKTETMQ